MKTMQKLTQKLTAVKLLVAVLAAACLFAAAANAQPMYSGKFTLPSEVRWGKATLPAGEYQFTLNSPNFATIREISGKYSAFVMPLGVNQYDVRGRSALVITVRGNHRTVRELRLAEIGLTLNFQPRREKAEKVVQEAQQIQQVPVYLAKR